MTNDARLAAEKVGEYFVDQYFKIFWQQREVLGKFYTDSSSVIHVDGDVRESASGMEKIHQLIMSLNFTGIEIDTISSLKSWAGGVLVAVSGSVKSRDFSGSRKFVQTFFLAPQEKGYFVQNDMFHFSDEGSVRQPVLLKKEQKADDVASTSDDLPHVQVSEHPLEEPTNSPIYVEEDRPVKGNRCEDHQQESGSEQKVHDTEAKRPEEETPKEESCALETTDKQEPQAESKQLEEDIPEEDSSVLPQNTESIGQESHLLTKESPLPEEPVEEPRTYASILRSKGKSPASIRAPIHVTPRPPRAANSQSSVQQPRPTVQKSGSDVVEQVVSVVEVSEGESHSVYVKNLPSTVTSVDILEEFKNFGKIKDDGVFLRNRKDTGVCFAFVEFQDVDGVQSAVKASPILLLGKKVYIEERISNPGAAVRGGRRGGRGRGGRGRSFGRGSEQNGSDNFRSQSNGSHT